MDPISFTAAAGMRSRMESLEMLANNIANAATSGYKADRESFSLYLSEEALVSAASSGADALTLPVIERSWVDHSQGLLTPSGNPLDLALAGKGFFAVNGPAGTLYTRNGNFRLSSSGLLETREGYAVRAAGGRIMRLDPNAPVEVRRDGTVFQNGIAAGRLEVVEVTGDQPGAAQPLEKLAGVYFRLAGAGGTSLQPAQATEVQQGMLETSNASAAESAVRLVGVLRQFEMLQKAGTLAGEMNRRAIEEVARVG
ncbi:MAG: flagellar hook basal-body protein [Bryobacteraceae bacterium]